MMGFGAALAVLVLPSLADAAAVPKRVVSMNVCTDQIAMLVVAPGQLRSVSYLATNPHTSAMAGEAAAVAVNHGQAEEIFLMRPDLVIAGTYTTRTTVNLLKRLGFRVEEFAPAVSFDDIRVNIRRMGELLGREERAEALVARFDDRLSRLHAAPSGIRTALTFASSYTSGSGTLSQAALDLAGLDNIAVERGISGSTRLPLEVLVATDPDLLVSADRDYGAPALAGETFVHPAYRALARRKAAVSVPSKLWVCGGPFTLQAVRILREAAERLTDQEGDGE